MRRALALLAVGYASQLTAADRPPNVIMLYADDLGYGDLGCYGAAKIKTPNLDRIAQEGVRFTDFYSAQPVCSASRTALLTGCYPNRVGIAGALGPAAKIGISDTEVTLGEIAKQKGYATAAVGKWHLGHRPKFLPTRHGFDSYLGLPYSNDMWPRHPTAPKGYPPLPLIDGETAIDPDVSPEAQATLTRRYTDRATQFIAANKAKPFLLYVAYSFPHVPLFAGEKYKGKSAAGLYGDVVEEIDGSVGEILTALKTAGVDENTLVMFSSDNGPWLTYGNHGGSAGPLREGKGTVWDGGVREPFVARWPGKIPAGSVQREPAMTIDVLPTVAGLIGAELPKHKIDGLSIKPLLCSEPGAKCPHEAFYFYYRAGELQAVRAGNWKLILPHTYSSMVGQTPGKDGSPGKAKNVTVERPELYDLSTDVGEARDVAAENPEVVRRLQGHAEVARADLGDKLTNRTGSGVRPVGMD